MKVNAKTIAKELNISAAAVSMALNNKPGVSEETRAKVFEAANKLGFKFSKKMLKRNNKMIAFVFFHKNYIFDSPFFYQLCLAVEDGIKRDGYHLNAYHIHDGEDIPTRIKAICEDDPVGIIYLGTLLTPSEVSPLNNVDVPILMLDAYFQSFKGDTIVINNQEGAAKATKHLLKNIGSCPGYIKSSKNFTNFTERSNGFYESLRQAGYHSSNAIVHQTIPSIDGAYHDMLDIINRNETLAKGYFCDNDEIAIGAIKAFKEKGFKIPEDISIVGFDNTKYAMECDPPLTTIDVPKHYMGKLVSDRILRLIKNDEELYPIKVEINTSLIIRNSVK